MYEETNNVVRLNERQQTRQHQEAKESWIIYGRLEVNDSFMIRKVLKMYLTFLFRVFLVGFGVAGWFSPVLQPLLTCPNVSQQESQKVDLNKKITLVI